MDWVIVVGLGISIVTLTVAAIGTGLSYLNHRARRQKELPKVQLYQTGGIYHIRLETDHHSIGWKLIRVEVVGSDYGKEILSQTLYKTEKHNQDVTISSYVSEWRDFCEYSEGAPPLTEIYFHDNCYEAYLIFVCETPSKVWWKPWRRGKKRVPYKYIRGTHLHGGNDPFLKSLLENQ